MREGVLFEITKDHLETGLRGVPVGYCVTSLVDPKKGLAYAGIPISEIAHLRSMDMIYLLYFGELGKKEQVAQFEHELKKRAFCKKETLEAIGQLPKAGHPMDGFAASLLIAGMTEETGDIREDCLNVIAKLPQIAAHFINTRMGWGHTPHSQPELGFVENFVHMLQLPEPKTDTLMQVMSLFHILHLDHDGGNLSTFVGKAVASGLEGMYGSLAASMTALGGPRHGRANQDALEFLKEMMTELGEDATPQDVDQWIRSELAKKELIYGFGHAVLRVEDPRATICYQYCQKHFPKNPLVRLALIVRSEGTKILKENPKISNPYPNVDAITGAMLMAAGFPYPDYFTILFGLSRCIGIAIQIVYERLEARGGKGVPIMRPLYLYKARSL